jgi:hypothetical protein
VKEPAFDVGEAGRWFAAHLNNSVWDRLDRGDLSGESAEEMIHAAHAACHHWMTVGTAVHHQRALVLLARVYADLGLGEAAMRHAERCAELTREHADRLEDWDRAFAALAMARALAASGRAGEARARRREAAALGARITDPEDRKVFEKELAAGRWHGVD